MSTDKNAVATDATGKALARLRDRVRSRLGEMRISAREASRRAGFNVGYVGDLLEGRSKAPELDRIMRLAATLELPVGELVGGESAETHNEANTNPQDFAALSTGETGGMVPLFSARIAMNEPLSRISDNPVGFVPALPALVQVRGAYAVTVFNNMNEPRYFPGEVIYMSPIAAPAPGDFIFGKLVSGFAGIGRFAKVEDGKLTIERIGAPAGVERFASYSLDEIDFYHRIVGSVG